MSNEMCAAGEVLDESDDCSCVCHLSKPPEGVSHSTKGALQLYLQVKAFAEDCVASGDMTPAAEQVLLKVLTDWGKP